jgi:anthranilate/para-aminobenzoate synthase component II
MCNPQSSLGKKGLLVDHEDSFVHTLANYFRQTGAAVEVLRAPFARKILQEGKAYDLVVLSPGPGSPAEFALDSTIDLVLSRGLPLFGVCLGLQGIVEYFGGVLGQLDYPGTANQALSMSATALRFGIMCLMNLRPEDIILYMQNSSRLSSRYGVFRRRSDYGNRTL